MENILWKFSCISFLFKPPWLLIYANHIKNSYMKFPSSDPDQYLLLYRPVLLRYFGRNGSF